MRRSPFVLALASVAAFSAPAHGFAGEEFPTGSPWHHYDISVRALAGDAEGFGWPASPLYPGAGFSREAAHAVAWHADNIDSYLYSPLFLAKAGAMGTGGFDAQTRLKGAAVAHGELVKLHFDDNPNHAGVMDAWRRYASGALVGLEWAYQRWRAAEGDPRAQHLAVAAAHQVLGYSSHAIQDFYAHSTWVNDSNRWHRTFLEQTERERAATPLYTGSYELDHGLAHHGKYSLACAVLQDGSEARQVLDTLCVSASPFVHSAMCEQKRLCQKGARNVDLGVAEAGRIAIALEPAGIALDNSLLARAGGGHRKVLGPTVRLGPHFVPPPEVAEHCSRIVNLGVSPQGSATSRADDVVQRWTLPTTQPACTDPHTVFATAKHLAIRTTGQWVNGLGAALTATDGDDPHPRSRVDFWAAVRGEVPAARPGADAEWTARVAQVEDLALVPYTFLSAGPYPTNHPATYESAGEFDPDVRMDDRSSDGVYLRLDLTTSSKDGSDTDAVVRVRASDGKRTRAWRLDHMPMDERGGLPGPLTYDDFQRGQRAVYVVGPLDAFPEELAIEVEKLAVGDLAGLVIDDLSEAASDALTGIRQGATALVGGDADFVGQRHLVLTAEQLAEQVAQTEGNVLRFSMDGGDAGFYDVEASVVEIDAPGAERRFRVTAERLICHRATPPQFLEDEPFFFFTAVGFNGATPGKVEGTWVGPVSGIEAGSVREVSRRQPIDLVFPDRKAQVVLASQVWESDLETAHDRRELWTLFTTGQSPAAVATRSRTLDRVGGLWSDADLRLSRIEVFGFQRGSTSRAGPMARIERDTRIEAGKPMKLALDATKLVTVGDGIDLLAPRPPALELPEAPTELRRQRWQVIGVADEGPRYTFRYREHDPMEVPEGRTIVAVTFDTETIDPAAGPSFASPEFAQTFLLGADGRSFALGQFDAEDRFADIAELQTRREVTLLFDAPIGTVPVGVKLVSKVETDEELAVREFRWTWRPAP